MFQGKFLEARDLLEGLLLQEPLKAIVLAFLGLVYYYTGQFQQSAEIGERARKAMAGSQATIGLFAKLSAAMGQREKALEYVKAIEKLGEIDTDAVYDIASTYARIGDERKAIQWLKQADLKFFDWEE